MRILSENLSVKIPTKVESKKDASSKESNRSKNREMSKSEIREKIKLKEQTKVGKKTAENDISSTKNHSENPFITDIKSNDPNSDETKGKLRKMLSTGGFSFNPNEQQVLQKILEE